MEPVLVEGLGRIHEVPKVWYAQGLSRLHENGFSFSALSARNAAYARTKLPTQHEFNQRGNWVAEEIAFGVPGFATPILIRMRGPNYHNAERAARAHEVNDDLNIDDESLALPDDLKRHGTWSRAIATMVREDSASLRAGELSPTNMRAFPLPSSQSFRIETDEMAGIDPERVAQREYFLSLSPNAQVAAFVFADQARRYAREVLLPNMILNVLVMLPEARKPRPYAQPLWLGSLSPGCGSCLVGCVCGDWMRGIEPKGS